MDEIDAFELLEHVEADVVPGHASALLLAYGDDVLLIDDEDTESST